MKWDRKQKRTFQRILTGLTMGKHQHKRFRFLTLTTSDVQKQSENFGKGSMNKSFRMLKSRILHLTPLYLILHGYITAGQKRSFYPNKPLNQPMQFAYFKVETDEGNGVLHTTYKGDFLPHTWLVDNWTDIHNSWDVNIKEINTKDTKGAAAYVVSQYLSSQKAAYIRSSWSWTWAFKGFATRWKNLVKSFQNRCYYNPVQNKYFKNHKEVNIIQLALKEWNFILRNLALPQSSLNDYG
jgi:hypothetical protein